MTINCPKFLKKNSGFTLIELLVVIGILAILLSIVLIAINPARQFGQANNTKRRSDVTQILNAIGAFSADNKGVLPANIPLTTPQVIGDGVGQANICADILTTYIPALPRDPQTPGGDITSCTTYSTNYTVVKDANNRVTVAAPGAENGETISISR
ncbi:MAG: type II secretion system protein [Candidatus Levybacteria bacterium]|nr:type II secretion system protein [Candidatus Levybacteria bacterium]MBP9716652.1 type II secretion system protein [Candidatus Levybacteria bacterium]